jgi:NagD protein
MPADLSLLRHVVLDMDGTIYRGTRLFDATLPFLERLQRLGIGYTFLTNNTSRARRDYIEKLHAFGIDPGERQIRTPADSAIHYLRRNLAGVERIAVLGTPSLAREFEDAGFRIDWDSPGAVVVGFDMTLTYERLCRTAWLITRGLPYIATHPDFVCPTDEPTVLVDCGSICACLAAATGRRPDAVLGKPDPSFLLELCEELNLAPDQMAMVGDRIYTDIEMARRAGVVGVLVLSGEASRADAQALATPPDLVIADIGELGLLLERRGA